MQSVIVYIDDADHARAVLAPLVARAGAAPCRWIVVACAPRMTHRISKWVSHSARENWRAKWADKLFAQVLPWLGRSSTDVTTVLAKGPLPELAEQLRTSWPENLACRSASGTKISRARSWPSSTAASPT